MAKAHSTPRPTAGSIYAIGTGDSSLVKIGSTTTSVEQRLKSLQTAHPTSLHIVARQEVETDVQRIEHQIHRFLAAERQRGEWFALKLDTEELAALIQRAVDYLAEQDEQAKRKEEARRARHVKTKRAPRIAMARNRLQQKRKALGLTLEEAAALSGVNRGTLSRLERDEQRLDAYYLRLLATSYQCTVDDLTPDEPGPPPLPRGKYKNTPAPTPEEVPLG